MTNIIQKTNERGIIRSIVRWGLYPISWLIILLSFHLIYTTKLDPRVIWMGCIGVLFSIYMLAEVTLPYQKKWSMNFSTFIADIKFIVFNGAFLALLSSGLALFTITVSGSNSGFVSDLPKIVQLGMALLIFELINYGLHRFMHEGRGKVGKFMWLLHAAHHLPPRLYLLMHAVFHPFNAFFIQTFAIILPVWLMGYEPNVVAMFLIINGMHGLISHFNVDVRMGFLNYIFIGPELHRYHHSASMSEAKNYGAVLSIYDLIFGTFIYHPNVAPNRLGVFGKSALPAYEKFWKVIILPFQKR
ncbi:MAG: sterol desaturase family protein [Rhizobiales bacterium]|nr:sterol desaturase family protein [Hyphomicrobiales bacterium]